MSEIFSELGGITAGVAAEGLAFAAGFAAARALEPAAVTISQDAWNAAPVRRVPPDSAAEIAAENIAAYKNMESEASYDGWDASRFAYLYHLNLIAPGTGQLLQMLRHGTINDGNFSHGLRKNKLEPMWDAAIQELQTVRLTPQELALGIVRSTIADPGLLVTTLDTSGSTIPKYPVWPGSTLDEAAAGGVDKDRLRAMVGAVGLPMSPQQAASATFRKIINRAAFNLSILEGDIRPEYADSIFEQARQIPSADNFVEHHLRGWRTQQEMYDGTALHGMTQANTDVLYQIHRRPLTPHQIKQALARGASFNPEAGEITDPYTASVHQANLGPEWYEMGVALQGSYPPLFQINRLVTAGIIDAATGADWMRKSGEADEVVTALHTFWSQAKPTAADPHVTKAQNQLWTTIHTMHKKGEITDAQATAALPSAGVDAAVIPEILQIWDVELGLVQNQQTPPA